MSSWWWAESGSSSKNSRGGSGCLTNLAFLPFPQVSVALKGAFLMVGAARQGEMERGAKPFRFV